MAQSDFSDCIVDISHYQTITSFHEVQSSGIQAIINKCTEGALSHDPLYKSNHARATSVGLLWGSYHFLRPGSPERQAEHFLQSVLRPSVLMLDCEVGGCTQAEAEAFVERIAAETGKYPLFYSYESFLRHFLTSSNSPLSKCPLVIAKYSSTPPEVPSLWPTWSIWQNGDGVHGFAHPVPGIGPCDRDRFHRPAEYLADWWAEHVWE